jgi:ferritin-like metal-binding protein YciE
MPTGPETLQELLFVKLQALFDLESCLTKAWPSIVSGASARELKSLIRASSRDTHRKIIMLKHSFRALGWHPQKLQGEAIRGLIQDAKWVIKNVRDRKARDINLTAAVRYLAHYQEAGYRSAYEWAKILATAEVQRVLRSSVQMAVTFDKRLNKITTSMILTFKMQ